MSGRRLARRTRAQPARPRWALLLLLGVASACSGDPASKERATALLGGKLADSPWPSDLFLVDGKLKIDSFPFVGKKQAFDKLSAGLAVLDGAPLTSSIFFATDGKGGLVDGMQSESAQLYDLSADGAKPRALKLFYRAQTRELVALAPLDLVLREGHRYACILGDERIAPSPEMAAALRGEGPHAAVYAPLVSAASAREIDLDQVGAATVFTTGKPTARLVALRRQLDKTKLPKARVTKVISGSALDDFFGTPQTKRSGLGDPKGVVHDAIGAIVLGTFEAPYYLSGAHDQLGLIRYGSDGAARQNGTVQIPFLLALPRNVDRKVPLLIYQHGLNSGRIQVAVVANDYARAGYATIGVDALWHGERTPGHVDTKHNLTGASGADGVADLDPSGAMVRFFVISGDSAAGVGALDGRYIQDNFRQAVVELGQLVRLVKDGDLSAVAAADASLAKLSLDGSHPVYTSESFGSVLGAMLLAVDPSLEAAVLSVGGGGLVKAVFGNSPFFADVLGLILRTNFDRDIIFDAPKQTPAAAQRSLSLLQAVLEPGDPAVYAPRVARRPDGKARSALLLQAYSDEVLPNQAGELLASAIGATAVEVSKRTKPLRYVELSRVHPPLSGKLGKATLGILNIDPATHGMFAGFSGERDFEVGFPPFKRRDKAVDVDNPTEWVRKLAVRFAGSVRDGKPAITVP